MTSTAGIVNVSNRRSLRIRWKNLKRRLVTIIARSAFESFDETFVLENYKRKETYHALLPPQYHVLRKWASYPSLSSRSIFQVLPISVPPFLPSSIRNPQLSTAIQSIMHFSNPFIISRALSVYGSWGSNTGATKDWSLGTLLSTICIESAGTAFCKSWKLSRYLCRQLWWLSDCYETGTRR